MSGYNVATHPREEKRGDDDTKQSVITVTGTIVRKHMENMDIATADNAATNADMVSKERVAELIKQAKASAAEKARLEMEALYQEKQAGAGQANAPQSVGGMAAPNMDELYGSFRERLLAEAQAEQAKAYEEQRKEQANQITQKFFERLGAADREAYKDFDEVTGQLNLAAFPQLVQLTTEFDNTADLVYDLAANPGKLAQLDYLAKTDPNYALSQLKRLSESIKLNQQAKEEHLPTNPPLSTMKPSAKAGTDSGDMSISDLRKLPSLRG